MPSPRQSFAHFVENITPPHPRQTLLRGPFPIPDTVPAVSCLLQTVPVNHRCLCHALNSPDHISTDTVLPDPLPFRPCIRHTLSPSDLVLPRPFVCQTLFPIHPVLSNSHSFQSQSSSDLVPSNGVPPNYILAKYLPDPVSPRHCPR